MPSIPISELLRRTGDSSSFSVHLGPISIVGICLIGVIATSVVVWLGIRAYRKFVKNRRENNRGAAFLSIRGLVPEGEQEKGASSDATTISSGQIPPSAALPEKVLPRLPLGKAAEEILEHHRQSGNFPKPFAPRPFSFALHPPSTTSRRQSNSSWISQPNRFSAMSAASTMSAASSATGSGLVRRVRQIFTPVLPDELLITGLGERLTVIESFDDGWCVVGRENSIFAAAAKSLFRKPAETNVEVGVIPAWCFLKPVAGIRAERPMRTSSLGITVHMNAPKFSSREEVMSWSNF